MECRVVLADVNRARANAWYEANRERALANVRAYYETNGDKVRAYNIAFAKANRHINNAASRRYRAANLEKCREKVRRYYAANLEKVRAKARVHSAANRPKQKVNSRAWRAANPERCNQMAAAWRKANPEKAKATSHKSRAKRMLAEGSYSGEDIKRIYRDQKCKCALCKTSITQGFHIDHIQPLSKGGTNWPRNLQLLCKSCNLRKSARDPIEHARSLGMLL
jgi:5-methylcytosine-specific restriction endonuclease McrA